MKKITQEPALEVVAGNGLLHRRLFLTQGAALVGAGLVPATCALAAAPELPDAEKAYAHARETYRKLLGEMVGD